MSKYRSTTTWLKCPACGRKTHSVYGDLGVCYRCNDRELVEIPCKNPDCTNARLVQRRYSTGKAAAESFCFSCAGKGTGKRILASQSRQRVKAPAHIEAHGCLIMPTSRSVVLPGLLNNHPYRAARCSGYSECIHGLYSADLGAEACCDLVGDTWPMAEGWVAAGEPVKIDTALERWLRDKLCADSAHHGGVSMGRSIGGVNAGRANPARFEAR